jgi:hypothetical protein
VELLVVLLLRRTGDDEVAVRAIDGHVRVKLTAELTLGALHGQAATVDRDVDTGGNGDGQATDSGHRGYQT